ncbi:hypothetical protein Q5752_003892 [Cryptotrichosporon argae]
MSAGPSWTASTSASPAPASASKPIPTRAPATPARTDGHGVVDADDVKPDLARLPDREHNLKQPALPNQPALHQPELDQPARHLSALPCDADADAEAERAERRKRRKLVHAGYAEDEVDGVLVSAGRYALALSLDQATTLYPPVPAAFASLDDAVDSLVPYHIWQIADEELDGSERKDEQERKAAEELVARVEKIKTRFTRLRQRPGHHPAPLPDLIALINASAVSLRDELQTVQSSLRLARAQWSAIEETRRRAADRAREDERRQSEAVWRAREARERAERAERAERERRDKADKERERERERADRARAENEKEKEKEKEREKERQRAAAVKKEAKDSDGADKGEPATRGRPRGRPRGRGRGGASQPATTHADVKAQSTAGQASAAPAPTAPAPLATAGPAPASVEPGQAAAADAKATKRINVSIPASAVRELMAIKIVHLPPEPGQKPPGMLVRASEDKKTIVLNVDIAECTPQQLKVLARVLNVEGYGGSAGAVAAGPGAGAGTMPAAQ